MANHARSRRPGEWRTVTNHLPPEAWTYFAHDRAWCLQQTAGVGPACARLTTSPLGPGVRASEPGPLSMTARTTAPSRPSSKSSCAASLGSKDRHSVVSVGRARVTAAIRRRTQE